MATATTPHLEALLHALTGAADGLTSVDLASLSAEELCSTTLRLSSLIDRLTAGHALVVAEADRRGVWASAGARSMTGWLADLARTSFGRAADLVRLADSMGSNALLAEKVTSGEMSTATAVALHAAVVTPPGGADADAVDHLVDLCAGSGPRDAKAAAEIWAAQHQIDTDDELEARRGQRRAVHFSAPCDGMVTMTALLPTLAANSVRKALCSLARLQSASAEPSATRAAHGGDPAGAVDGSTPQGTVGDVAVDTRTTVQRLADALVQLAAAATKGDLAGREAPTLLVTIDLDSLEGRADRPGVTEFGDRVTATAVRQLIDDAAIRTIVHRGAEVIGVGREARLATRAQYAALVARDGRCRWNGCRIPASWCEVDHLVPWHAGGRTDLDNLVLWCSHHHHRKHDPGVQVLGDAHSLRLRLADGTVVQCPPEGVVGAPPGRVSRRTPAVPMRSSTAA